MISRPQLDLQQKHRVVRALTLGMLCAMIVSVSAMTCLSRDDQDALQGVWRLVEQRIRTDSQPALIFSGDTGMTLKVVGNKLTMTDLGNGQGVSSTFAFTL